MKKMKMGVQDGIHSCLVAPELFNLRQTKSVPSLFKAVQSVMERPLLVGMGNFGVSKPIGSDSSFSNASSSSSGQLYMVTMNQVVCSSAAGKPGNNNIDLEDITYLMDMEGGGGLSFHPTYMENKPH